MQAQAKARRADPRLVVIDHPIGGLSETELAGRIDAAFDGVLETFRAMEVLP
ncbi:hypothetical protein WCD74_00995 [Actinomycetospora sp. OC33-EN08]|uniref:Uncharacterized protein n=1 Tax=Actinomycetospora aurantiaca TaxID=3129233 RepID=A0ABU8MG63_9PSEU